MEVIEHADTTQNWMTMTTNSNVGKKFGETGWSVHHVFSEPIDTIFNSAEQ